MLQIRCSCFETNSSSSNVIILLTAHEFNLWKGGEGFVDADTNTFYTTEEVLDKMKDDEDYKDNIDDKEQVEEFAQMTLNAFSYKWVSSDEDIGFKSVARDDMVAATYLDCSY